MFTKVKLTCDHCGGTDLYFDTQSVWDFEKQDYILYNVLEYTYCGNCCTDRSVNEILIYVLPPTLRIL
jgi:hypothetical protein